MKQGKLSRLLTGPRIHKTGGHKVQWYWRAMSFLWRAGVVLALLAAPWLIWSHYDGPRGTLLQTAKDVGYVSEGLICAWVTLWVLIAAVAIFISIDRQVDVATTPVPTPAEISWQLQQEWGRPATVEEVYAVHRMLTDKRNEAAVIAGAAIVGPLYLLHKK